MLTSDYELGRELVARAQNRTVYRKEVLHNIFLDEKQAPARRGVIGVGNEPFSEGRWALDVVTDNLRP